MARWRFTIHSIGPEFGQHTGVVATINEIRWV